MTYDFTESRIKRFLEKYEADLNKLAENEEDLTDADRETSLGEIIVEIRAERDRAEKEGKHILQETNYVPALDEALNFLEQAIEALGTMEFESKLYDACISLSYYRVH